MEAIDSILKLSQIGSLGLYLLGRLVGDGTLARQRLDDALALGQVQAPTT